MASRSLGPAGAAAWACRAIAAVGRVLVATACGGKVAGPDAGVDCFTAGAAACSDAEYCSYTGNRCGRGTPSDFPRARGDCLPRPRSCQGQLPQLTCGCDGQLYPNGCEAVRHGTDIGNANGCALPPNLMPCDAMFCDVRETYCRSERYGPPRTLCVALPDACLPEDGGPPPGCSCLSDAVPQDCYACGLEQAGGGARGLGASCGPRP